MKKTISITALILLTTLLGCQKTAHNDVVVTPSYSLSNKIPFDDKVASVKKVEKMSFKDSQVITLLGEVTEQSVDDLVKEIKKKQTESAIYLLIDSPGGSVLDGALLISAMEASKVPVYTVCLKLCASMGFIIHQYGKERYMVDRSILMAHPASGGASPGQLENISSLLDTIRRYVDKLNSRVAKRLNLSDEEFKRAYAYGMWIDAEDSTLKGLNDKIVSLTYSVKAAPLGLESKLHETLRNFKWE